MTLLYGGHLLIFIKIKPFILDGRTDGSKVLSEHSRFAHQILIKLEQPKKRQVILAVSHMYNILQIG